METTVSKRSFDLGPGVIALSSMEATPRNFLFGNYDTAPEVTTEAPDFVLSNEEWFTIQCYVAKALALPNTLDKFKAYLGPGAPENLNDFTKLVNAYDNMNKHVNVWRNDTFPATVSLASDIYNYSTQVEVYYKPILPLAKKLIANPGDKEAKDKLAAIIAKLSEEARAHQKKAADVAAQVKEFANRTYDDKIELAGEDGKSGLTKYYTQKYGESSEKAKKLAQLIKNQQDLLDKLTKDYNHYVTVAATTPSYAWVGPFGLIAAAIVAGTYGKKAVEALDGMRAAQKQIDMLQDEEKANTNLLLVLQTTNSGVTNILGSIDKALPLIEKIRGAWDAIANDLEAIVKLIHKNIEEALPIIMDLGVESAIVSWQNVGKAADKYRQNAYITIQGS